MSHIFAHSASHSKTYIFKFKLVKRFNDTAFAKSVVVINKVVLKHNKEKKFDVHFFCVLDFKLDKEKSAVLGECTGKARKCFVRLLEPLCAVYAGY
jgi:hypothetical protein